MGLFSSSPKWDDLQSLRADYDVVEQMHDERVGRLKMYRREGAVVRDPNATMLADTSDYGRYQKHDGQHRRHNLQLPFGKAITVKHAYRIAGQMPDIVVDQASETPQERHRSDSMEKIAWAVIHASRGQAQFAAAGWNASELGSGCFDLYMDYERNMPIFRSIDPIGIYHVPGVEDPHDFQRVYRVWDVPVASLQHEYKGKTFRGVEIPVGDFNAMYNEGGVDMARVVAYSDKEQSIRFAIGAKGGGVVGLNEYQHDYGFVPYVIIPNLGPYEDVWGWADYEFVRTLTQYIPKLLSREADHIAAIAAGAYTEEATGQSATAIQDIIRKGGVLPIKRDSAVNPIQAADMPSFADRHHDSVMESLKMLGFVPDAAWGKPGSGSGSDRGLQLQPLLEYTAMKQLNWGAGMSRLFNYTFRMIEKKMVGTSTYRGAAYSGKTQRRSTFAFTFGPQAPPEQIGVDGADPFDEAAIVELPRTPKDLFAGDYEIRFSWRNQVDPNDPAYVLSELNKFQQGAQSLETTLENLGVQAPEEEMRRIEAEAERFPWVNQGLVTLLLGQIRGNAQGTGGGAPPDVSGALSGAMETMASAGGGQSGALDADAGAEALGPGAQAPIYGGA